MRGEAGLGKECQGSAGHCGSLQRKKGRAAQSKKQGESRQVTEEQDRGQLSARQGKKGKAEQGNE